jgi:hypothetical protein
MAIQLIGGAGEVPFNRTFFNVSLGDLLDQSKEQAHRLTLFLSDGATLDLCQIDDILESYLSVRAYRGQDDSCDLSVHLIPYGLIYRIEISPRVNPGSGRMGFSRNASARENSPIRKK